MKNIKIKFQTQSDLPISKVSDDFLGNNQYANQIVSLIKSWDKKENLVVGIHGSWGSGKTSLKNLILNELNRLYNKEEKPYTLEFNPWMWSGQDSIMEAFFDELSSKLGKEKQDVSEKLQKYSTYLNFGSKIAKSLKIPLTLLATPVAGGLAAIIEKVLESLSEVTKSGSKASKNPKTLSELKKELNNDFKKLEKPILIIIDDIDRLFPEEMKLVFQLIKSNADFPNVIYLLLFDRIAVEDSLCKYLGKELTASETIVNKIQNPGPEKRITKQIHNSSNKARDFLDKIIQISLNIPEPEKQKLEEFLTERIFRIITNNENIQRHFNKDRWERVFYDISKIYFKNLRNVKRFLNSFAFHLQFFVDDKGFDVDFVDLFVLEVLRLFEPDVYSGIYKDSHNLINDADAVLRYSGIINKNYNIVLTELAKKTVDSHKACVKELLYYLIPNTYPTSEEFKEQRLYHPEIFNRYFQFKLEGTQIKNSYIRKIIESSNDLDKLNKILEEYNNEKLLLPILEKLIAFCNDIPPSNYEIFITAIFNLSEKLYYEKQNSLMPGLDRYIYEMISIMLQEVRSEREKLQILINSIKESKGLYLPLMVCDFETKSLKEKGPKHFSENYLKEIQSYCLEKITEYIKHNDLLNHNKLVQILFSWKSFLNGQNNELSEWFMTQIKKDDKSVVKLLSKFTDYYKITCTKKVLEVEFDRGLEAFLNFIGKEEIESRIDDIKQDELSPTEKKIINGYKKSLRKMEIKETNKNDK